jgi:HECT-domain (ubiquitin-transferase)
VLALGWPKVCNPWTQVELVPGGREVAVTDANKLAYIHRVADFRLNTQLVGAHHRVSSMG